MELLNGQSDGINGRTDGMRDRRSGERTDGLTFGRKDRDGRIDGLTVGRKDGFKKTLNRVKLITKRISCRSQNQYSYEKLSKCHLYHIEAYMRQRVNADYLTVVLKNPSEIIHQIFPTEYLYWTRPGFRFLKFQLTNNVSGKIELGSEITFGAVYEFCCRGPICPTCPITVELHAFGKIFVVNRNLKMDCQEHKFRQNISADVQPGNHSIDISFSFLDDIIDWKGIRNIVKSITVSDSTNLQCSFYNGKCPGWIVSSNASLCQWNFEKDELSRKKGFIALTSPGVSFLESPFMPWNSNYKRIKLCVEFSYLLSTNTTSRLEVYKKTSSTNTLLWLLSGNHGMVWERAKIPVFTGRNFKIIFKGYSETNNSVSIAIRDFQMISRLCRLRPLYAEPEFQCKVTEFRCGNGKCVSRKYRCNGVNGDCLDNSDEYGCVCQTGYFTCSNKKCIDHTSLCDGIRDCQNGEDEHHCDNRCPEYQCFDGTCKPCGLHSSCEDDRHYHFCEDETSINQLSNSTGCKIQGICGFDNELCGLQNDTDGSLYWEFFKPVDFQFTKNNFPDHDHTAMTNEGNYIFLKSNKNVKSGYGRLVKHWNITYTACMQFWYAIPDKFDSSLQIFIDTYLLWETSDSSSGDWAYGQVEIPGNTSGKAVIISGYVNKQFVALDDLGFIEVGCASFNYRQNPSCYFDDDAMCKWDIPNSWTRMTLRITSKQSPLKDPVDAYVSLSTSNVTSALSSPLIHPRSEGWRCLRFWFYSGKKYFTRKVSVEFKAENKRTVEWSYGSEINKWTFIQLPIPKNQERLYIKILGEKYHNNAILAIKDITVLKENCQKIPAHQECQEYKSLSFSDRRRDKIAAYELFRVCDDYLSNDTWYRVISSAGNQLASSCIKKGSSCSTKNMGWVNGPIPSVEQGIVERKLCFASAGKCCRFETVVKIRNCKDYVVYQFPSKIPNCPSRYCGAYRHESLDSNTFQEWKGWLNGCKETKWEILYENSCEMIKIYQDISRTISRVDPLVNDYDVGLALHRNHHTNIKINETMKEMTLCLWLSVTNSLPLKVLLNYVKKENVEVVKFLKIDFMTRKGNRKWNHICVTWTSDFGVWQNYIDGAEKSSGSGVLDMENLHRGSKISITFNSEAQETNITFSRLNVWKNVLSKHYIHYMSYECGTETGNYLRWDEYLNALPEGTGRFRIQKSSCIGKQDSIMSLITKSSQGSSNIATIVSPRYEKSSDSPGRCLKFKYKMWGPGASSLTIYQELDNKDYSKRPRWMVKNVHDSRWKDGQVTLTAVTGYKLVIEGTITKKPGLLSIGGLYTTEGYCTVRPQSARQACNEILTNNTGYIISPYYPGYYDNNANCTWTIKANKRHVILLEIEEFELELSSQCSTDFVEVYDGVAATSDSRIGRYCGVRHQKIIQSQSSTMIIVFRSNSNITRTGFKAHYQTIKDVQDGRCIQDCPFDCSCRRLTNRGIVISSRHLRAVPNRIPKKTKEILFSGSKIFQVESSAFSKLDDLFLIDLSYNRIFVIEERSFVDLPSLTILRLNRNFIKEVQKNIFFGIDNVEAIDLGENLISKIGSEAFSSFPGLRVLSLRSNRLEKLHELNFQNNTNLTHLYLQDNFIKNIPSGVFFHQKLLKVLFLHKNRIAMFTKSSFEGLEMLETLTLKNNSINEQAISLQAFENLVKLKHLSLDSFILCCYATNAIPDLTCESPGNEFSSCNAMLKNIYARIFIWIEGVFAVTGNLAVIAWWTFISTRKGRRKKSTNVQSLLFSHLAFADFLMGIYLLFIGTYDSLWQNTYFHHDVEWRAGINCKIAGVISTLSSEVSVMILVAITADRMNALLFGFSGRRTNLKFAHVVCLCIWIIGFIISLTPLLVPTYFNDKVSGFSFYGRSTVCLPLQLSTDRPAGWKYSVGIFIGFNGAAFLFILVGYIAIFIKVRRSGRRVRSTRSSDSSLGKRVFFVILTDFCCWLPIMVLGVLSLGGHFNDPSVYIWIAVFVLPVNSSINPILYTFSSSQTLNAMASLRRKWTKDQERKRLTEKSFQLKLHQPQLNELRKCLDGTNKRLLSENQKLVKGVYPSKKNDKAMDEKEL